LRPNDKLLEVGCAFGRITKFLAKNRGVNAIGIDINPHEIKYAKENSVDSRVNFAIMDGTRLDFSDNMFDAIVMVGVVGGVEPEIRERMFKEAYRVVRPSGTVAIAEFKIDLDDPKKVKKYKKDAAITGEWGSKIVRKGNKILFIAKHFIEGELTKMFTDAGFSSIQSRRTCC
jgi:ubiquinone/menaquinone biosynthesis C-methylase UbiE